MPRKKQTIRYDRNRALLSDVLPFEVPLTFSNRHFLDLVESYDLKHKNGNIKWNSQSDAADWVIRRILGVNSACTGLKTNIQKNGRNLTQIEIELQSAKNKNMAPKGTIPYEFRISHKVDEARVLSVPHPAAQLGLVNFYAAYKELICYYCNVSNFSIRHPVTLAKHFYHKDRTHFENLATDPGALEIVDREYENLRTVFRYKDYSFIHKFYESYRYLRAEKKYNKLLKLDISKCFDSVYTHSINWAVFGKEQAKDYLDQSRSTFAGKFDQLMQFTNHRETNGIIIGPEFSRIFAEIILQKIDRIVEEELLEKGYGLRVEYEIFRYVDDYFIFFNDEEVAQKISEILVVELKGFKFTTNAEKRKEYDKPIITEISRAKRVISELLEKSLSCSLGSDDDNEDEFIGHINTKSMITGFKTAIVEADIGYKDILNYSLAIIERKTKQIITRFAQSDRSAKSHLRFNEMIFGVLEFSFFVYSASPRVNFTIKLCLIVQMIVEFYRGAKLTADTKHQIYKYIFDQSVFVLRKNKLRDHIQIETLYLLTILGELGKEYWIDEATLASYFGILKKDGKFYGTVNLNHFAITVLLFYMKNKVRYADLRGYIEEEVAERLKAKSHRALECAQTTILLMDIIACPYFEHGKKESILIELGVTDAPLRNEIISLKRLKHKHKRQLYFTNWDDFNFGRELHSKRGHEVY
ncbi:antiviral reverse transcriptase Drt3b [Parasphingorhabdus sp.]|uniref:antiviral reverse transcriptase Drt3b n=1 Tax=Parasphingorhabdus sp. TaxID=2709688 RepID=UPI003BB14064